MQQLAQATTTYGPFEGLGPLGTLVCAGGTCQTNVATTQFEQMLSLTVGVMTVVAGIWFMFGLITASIQWLSSGGDKQAVQSAAKKIGHSVVGLFLVVVSYGLIFLISSMVGFSILNPADYILNVLHP